MGSRLIKAPYVCLKHTGLIRTACCPLSLTGLCNSRIPVGIYAAQGRKRSFVCSANYQTTSQPQVPVVPSEFTGALREAYVAGYKVWPQILRIQSAAKALNSFQSGYAAGVQVTVSVNLNSGKNLKPVEYSGGIQQDSLLRSLLKGVVWRVFSTALTVGIILAVFRDTVQVEQALQIGGLEFVLKLFVYFAHERLWVQIGDSIN